MIWLEPTPNRAYQLSDALPAEVQRIPIEVASNISLLDVSFYLNGLSIGTVTAPPYRTQWTLAPGTYRLDAEARLVDGGTIRAETIEFRVYGADEDVTSLPVGGNGE